MYVPGTQNVGIPVPPAFKKQFDMYSRLLEKAKEPVKGKVRDPAKYADLQIPDTFSGAVKLLKLSTESQLESDIHLINWIEFGDESEKIRSDELLQQSFEYELAALTSFNEAKKGNP